MPLDTSLDAISIASPCRASWDAMTGDDRVRFCSECRLSVYNLSAMSRSEAEALVRSREGRTCVRFFRRADGTMLTRDCPVGWRAWRRRGLLACASAAVLCVTLFAWGLVWLFPVEKRHEDRGGDFRMAAERAAQERAAGVFEKIWDLFFPPPAPPPAPAQPCPVLMGKI